MVLPYVSVLSMTPLSMTVSFVFSSVLISPLEISHASNGSHGPNVGLGPVSG